MEYQGYTFWGECKGVKKDGTPCRSSTVYANGYCRHHGGDSSEFMRERLKRLRAKALRRLKRWERRIARARRRSNK